MDLAGRGVGFLHHLAEPGGELLEHVGVLGEPEDLRGPLPEPGHRGGQQVCRLRGQAPEGPFRLGDGGLGPGEVRVQVLHEPQERDLVLRHRLLEFGGRGQVVEGGGAKGLDGAGLAVEAPGGGHRQGEQAQETRDEGAAKGPEGGRGRSGHENSGKQGSVRFRGPHHRNPYRHETPGL